MPRYVNGQPRVFTVAVGSETVRWPAELGWSPALLFNEHINARDNLDRPHYHESSDVAAFVDPALGEAVTKVAAETAVWLATQP